MEWRVEDHTQLCADTGRPKVEKWTKFALDKEHDREFAEKLNRQIDTSLEKCETNS